MNMPIFENQFPNIYTFECHLIQVSAFRFVNTEETVSGSIEICFNARNGHLDQQKLHEFIRQAERIAETPSGLAQAIALQCATWLNSKVRVIAFLKLRSGTVTVRCVGENNAPINPA